MDRPDVKNNIVRVTGPFTFEATIPTSEGLDEEPDSPGIQGEACLLYTSDAADDLPCVDLGGRPILKKKNNKKKQTHYFPAAKVLRASYPLPCFTRFITHFYGQLILL